MTTKTIGEALQEERLKHRVKLEELSKRTRIRMEHLQALEDNRFQDLPASVFVKGYIKTYAQVFGFEYQPLLALLRRDYKESAKGTLVPREFIQPMLKRRRHAPSATLALVAASAVFTVLLGYVGYQWYLFSKPPFVELYSPTAQSIVAAKVVVQGRTVPEAIVLVNDQSVSLQPDGSFATELIANREGLFFITVTAQDRRGKVGKVERLVTVAF